MRIYLFIRGEQMLVLCCYSSSSLSPGRREFHPGKVSGGAEGFEEWLRPSRYSINQCQESKWLPARTRAEYNTLRQMPYSTTPFCVRNGKTHNHTTQIIINITFLYFFTFVPTLFLEKKGNAITLTFQ